MQTMVSEKNVEIQLHWSEYLQGEWSTRESGGSSAVISRIVRTADFYPADVRIHVSRTFDDGEESGVYITLTGYGRNRNLGSFYLAGRNSVPEIKKNYSGLPKNPYNATRYGGDDSLTVTFEQRITTEGQQTTVVNDPLSILQDSSSYTLLPCNNDITLGGPAPGSLDADNAEAVAKAIAAGLPDIASLIKPVFYQNATDTLFVEPNVTEQTVEDWKGWITRPPQVKTDKWKGVIVIPTIPWNPKFPGPKGPWPVAIDSGSIINPMPVYDWLVNPLTGLSFDDEVIGPNGRAGGLNVIGGAGFSPEVLENFNAINRSGIDAG